MERWVPTVGFKGLYEVSNFGRVRSLKTGRGTATKSGTSILTPSITKRGSYCRVYLRKDGKDFGKLVHNLVLEAFVGSCPVGMEGRHLNGISTDNVLTNLAWGTPKQNAADRDRHGRTVVPAAGERHPRAKLTTLQARAIKSDSRPQRVIAAEYGIHQATVYSIKSGETWQHV